jgi:mono/diheme cytochrome c family protein
MMPWSLPAQGVDIDDRTEVADHMHEHLARITTIKANVIMGNLDGVRAPAAWLADHDAVVGLPANFEPYVDLMRGFAREVLDASDLNSAGKSVSKMARTCGNCHVANHVELEFGYDQMPAEWADTISHMQRHQWAADRLWDGLIGPSDVAWNRGTNMLVDVPLLSDKVMDETTDGVDPGALDEIAHRLHLLGSQGSNARSANARSELYGEILGLCSDCHTMLGRGPGR